MTDPSPLFRRKSIVVMEPGETENATRPVSITHNSVIVDSPEAMSVGNLSETAREALKGVMAKREELAAAWVATYGFEPKDAIIEQRLEEAAHGFNLRVWIERDRGHQCAVHGAKLALYHGDNDRMRAFITKIGYCPVCEVPLVNCTCGGPDD